MNEQNSMTADVALKIKQHCKSSTWIDAATLSEDINEPQEHVEAVLEEMQESHVYECHCDTRLAGKGITQYRIIPGGGPLLPLDMVLDAVNPWLKELAKEGRKNAATVSISNVRMMTNGLRKTLERLAR